MPITQCAEAYCTEPDHYRSSLCIYSTVAHFEQESHGSGRVILGYPLPITNADILNSLLVLVRCSDQVQDHPSWEVDLLLDHVRWFLTGNQPHPGMTYWLPEPSGPDEPLTNAPLFWGFEQPFRANMQILGIHTGGLIPSTSLQLH